jgi:hypothetical protein
MTAAESAELVGTLPANLLQILALISQDRSNGEISDTLGYRGRSANVLIAHIYSKLGIGKGEVDSRIEKRRLAAEAYRKYQHGQDQADSHEQASATPLPADGTRELLEKACTILTRLENGGVAFIPTELATIKMIQDHFAAPA